jgi:N-acetylglucosamine malate deacetylase 1
VTLIFSPHQDDSTLGCGGLMAHRAAQGETIYVAYITDGAASHLGHPQFTPAMIASLRAGEARAAAGILGLPSANLFFLNAPDGRLPHLDNSAHTALVTQMRALIIQLAPHEVFCTSRYDGSTEHIAACAFVREALDSLAISKPALIEYLVWSRWNPRWLSPAMRAPAVICRHALSPVEAALKRDAMIAYRSQMFSLPPWRESVLPAYFPRMFVHPEEFFFVFKN